MFDTLTRTHRSLTMICVCRSPMFDKIYQCGKYRVRNLHQMFDTFKQALFALDDYA